MKCTSCGSENLKPINSADSEHSTIPTSDGYFLDRAKATRHMCQNCGIVSVFFEPLDRLDRFFEDEYDISDVVQNNQIVKNGETIGKHTYIQNNLDPFLETLPKSGVMLEIACGRGELVLDFAQRFPHWACTGVDPNAAANPKNQELSNFHFVHDFFKAENYEPRSFDCIVAHGILNRTPTLDLLKNIALLTRPNALVSIEFLTIDQSPFAPFVWDHPYTFTTEVFEYHLEHFGLEILDTFDCGSSLQYILKASGTEPVLRPLPKSLLESCQLKMQQQIDGWQSIKRKFETAVADHSGPVALFGAGLYSAVLLHLVGTEKVNYFIDEYRPASPIQEVELLDLEAATQVQNLLVPLCIRSSYMDLVSQKLTDQKIPHIRLENSNS